MRSLAQPIFFQRIEDSHCNRIYSSFRAVHCFDNGYVVKEPVALKENCVEYWLKELQESMDWCTGCLDTSKILLKKALTLYQTTNLDSVKLKEFTDDSFKSDENGRKFFKRVENTGGKGEIACYEQFLLFPQCFQKPCTTVS